MRARIPELGPDADLAPVVERLCADAIATHPEVRLPADAWGLALALAVEGASGSHAAGLAVLPAADLWLAAAAAANDPAAVDTFERTLLPEIDRALRRFSLPAADFDELRQCVRVRLLVASSSAPPRIAQYRGRGSLAGWIRIVATRTALNERRGQVPVSLEPDAFTEQLLVSTPELAEMRRESQQLFSRAFRGAFADLSPRERNLLRLRHIDELPLESLARAYQVHVSTASRWLSSARDALAAAFARRVAAELGESRAVHELVDLVRSRFDGSLRSLLSSERLVDDSPT